MSHIEMIRAEGLPEPISHYADAVLAGNTLYISGAVAMDENGAVVGKHDVVEQARQVFRNIGRVLEAAGGSASDVVKVTVFMRDVDDRAKINPVRKNFFGDHRPASTLVGVNRLVDPDLLLEIDAVAVLPK